MYSYKKRFLFAVLCVLLLCSVAQARNLLISVQDIFDNTSIPQATIFHNGANVGRTPNNGQFLITHPGTSDQNIRVAMTGYNDWEQTANSSATSLLVNLSRKDLPLKVSLFDSDTLTPLSGAKVAISADN